MMKDYEAEQTKLKETIRAYEALLEKRSESMEHIKKHIRLVEHYTDLKNWIHAF